MLATDCSERDSLAEPLSWIQALLLGGVDYPLLVLQIGDFTPYSFEPHSRLSGVADAPPELTDQIGQDGALFPWHTVIGFQRFFEHPRCVATEVPLGFDIAISIEAAKIKGIDLHNRGRPDILIMPNLEAGNMLYKQLVYLAHAECAGIVLGTRVPLVLTSRADSPQARVASCALAVLQARGRPDASGKA